MGKKDPRVDAYIANSAPFARPILKRIRKVMHTGCPEVEETLKWGFPHFMHKGILGSMASFKEHCAFGFWKASLVDAKPRSRAASRDDAMGQFGRLTAVSDLPSETALLRFVRKAAVLNNEGVKSPARSKPRAPRPLTIPAYFLDAVRANRKALAAFEGFSQSHQREYVDWVTEAKTDATRTRRLETTIQWLAQGKSRNWKYEKMKKRSLAAIAAVLLMTLPHAGMASDLDSSRAQGKAYLTEGRYQEAADLFGQLSEQNPGDADLLRLRARALAGLEDFDGAAEQMKRAVALADTSAAMHVGYAEMLFRSAQTSNGFQAMGKATEGKAQCERALQLDPNNEPALRFLFGFHLRVPAIAGGDRAEAKRLASQLQALAPDNVSYRLFDAELLIADKKLDEAEAIVSDNRSRCRTLDDSLSLGSAYNQMGYACLADSACGRAIAYFKEYGLWAPRDGNAHDSLGDAYARCGDREAAIAEYEKAVATEARFARISGEKARKLRDEKP